MIWTLSFERYFDTKNITKSTYLLEIASFFTVTDTLLNTYFQFKLFDSYRFDIFTEIIRNKKQIGIIAYFIILKIVDTSSDVFYYI